MKYRNLGRTGLRVSVIGVGTWQLGGEWGHDYTQAEVDAILDRAGERGINLIDTAECYGDHVSERLIGDYLARRGGERWIVATKFGHVYRGFMDRAWDASPDAVRRQMEGSLRALRREVIDLYQFHSGTDEAFASEELWSMLDGLKRAGKVRHLGVSILGKGSELQARRAAEMGAEALQVIYNRLDRRPEEYVFPHVREHGLGVLARVPLASGFLTGKYAPDAVFGPGDVRATFDAAEVKRKLTEADRIRRTEAPAGVPVAQWALAWCLRAPEVSAVIPGCRDVSQVESNAAAADTVAP